MYDPPGTVREKLTPAGEAYLLQHRVPPPQDDDARADAESASGGLKMVTRYDESGRPIREFSNVGSRKTWMDPYRSTPQEMIRIDKGAHPPGSVEANAFLARWEAKQAEIASGNIILPEI
ncbi:hypothetical protein ADM96_08270 [Burkholderia sp. ST111]|nr:hypothetical protein ADM96_08270 [Burkholderia sp. ST111]